jgi:hypothetical protein
MAEDSSIASGNYPGIPYQGAALALERGSPEFMTFDVRSSVFGTAWLCDSHKHRMVLARTDIPRP